MNVAYFQENLELMGHCGFKLTDMEAALIENSLIILQSENKLRKMFFFGRIDTSSDARYYIAFGYRKDILKERKFFYSLNCYEWFMMPELKPNLIALALQTRTLLTGEPMNVENVCKHPTFVGNNRDVRVPCPERVKKLKEEDRLVCMVNLIMGESAIIPRGAVYRDVMQNIIYRDNFKGLNRMEATVMTNYQLFRHPRNNLYKNLTKREDYNYQTDFFDTIGDLIPANCFSSTVNDRDVVILRALNWLGMTFVHKLNTPYHGCYYFGNGMPNLDLVFMTR